MSTEQQCSGMGYDGEPCTRPIITVKSGLCKRHYERAATARKAAARPARLLVREQKCFVPVRGVACGKMGYKRWNDPPNSVICQHHVDLHRRNGSFEETVTERGIKFCEAESELGKRCTNVAPYTQYGIFCQNHHRMAKLRGSADLTIEVHHGAPRTGVTDHRKKDAEVLAAELAARRAARTECLHGHPLSGDNLRVRPDGRLVCVICRDADQERYQASPEAQAKRDRCRAGHLLSDKTNASGVRICETCNRARALKHLYDLTLEQYDVLVEKQHGNCASCREPLALGTKSVAVDHDHACCSGPQSCGKCVRGLICNTCNSGIGFFKDNPIALCYAAVYLLTASKASAAIFERCANIILYEDEEN